MAIRVANTAAVYRRLFVDTYTNIEQSRPPVRSLSVHWFQVPLEYAAKDLQRARVQE
jgi:hypothetical protein